MSAEQLLLQDCDALIVLVSILGLVGGFLMGRLYDGVKYMTNRGERLP